jgi:hypothetical protein
MPKEIVISELVSRLRRRYRAQKSLRTNIEQVWDTIDYYTGPVKDVGSTATNPAGGTGGNLEQKRDLWDHTAIDSREKLAASIHGSATSSSFRWFGLTARKAELNRDNEVAAWLSEETENCWNDFLDSDFYVEIACHQHELAGPGHSFLTMEPNEPKIDEDEKGQIKEEWDGVDFTAVPLRDCYFEQDRKGNVKTFWRRLMWQASQVVDFCEDKKIAVPEDVAEALQKGETSKLFEYVFCVFPRPEVIKRKKLRYPAGDKNRPYGFIYFRESNGEQLGEEGGYYEKPIFMTRWSKTAGSKWGHGPGNQALPTVRYVNAWKELMRSAGEKAVDPPLMGTERNILSDPDLRAGGLTMVRNIEGLKPLESASKFQVGEALLKEDIQSIRHIFHTDELELKDSPAMTATEAQIRYEWMNRLLGKTLAYIQSTLGEIIITLLAMRVRMGAAKPMPAKLKKAGGLMNIEYQGPLARSQRTDEVAAIERGATFVAGLAQFYPEVRAALDPIEAVKLVFNRLGVPAQVMPPDNVLRQRMQQILDQQSQAIQAKTNADNASAAKDHAQARAAASGSSPVQGATYPNLPPVPNLTPGGVPYGGRA